MKVLLDVDGVFADFTYGFTKVAAELGLVKEPWVVEKQKTWKFDFHVGPVWAAIGSKPNWWMGLQPIPNTDEISRLYRRIRRHTRNQFFFVTNRKEGARGLSTKRQTELWLDSIGLPGVTVVLVDNKARWAVENGIDLALEDKPDNLRLLQAMDIKTVARRWQYNTEFEPAVDSLDQFIEEYL